MVFVLQISGLACSGYASSAGPTSVMFYAIRKASRPTSHHHLRLSSRLHATGSQPCRAGPWWSSVFSACRSPTFYGEWSRRKFSRAPTAGRPSPTRNSSCSWTGSLRLSSVECTCWWRGVISRRIARRIINIFLLHFPTRWARGSSMKRWNTSASPRKSWQRRRKSYPVCWSSRLTVDWLICWYECRKVAPLVISNSYSLIY